MWNGDVNEREHSLRGAASTRQILPRGGAKNLPAPRSRMITAQNKSLRRANPINPLSRIHHRLNKNNHKSQVKLLH
jgi:hypothetical protein